MSYEPLTCLLSDKSVWCIGHQRICIWTIIWFTSHETDNTRIYDLWFASHLIRAYGVFVTAAFVSGLLSDSPSIKTRTYVIQCAALENYIKDEPHYWLTGEQQFTKHNWHKWIFRHISWGVNLVSSFDNNIQLAHSTIQCAALKIYIKDGLMTHVIWPWNVLA